jgi:DNA polymerase-3 subunit delta'
VIEIPDQPLAGKVLSGAVARGRVPQQFLFFGPPGTGKRRAALRLAHHLIGMPDEEAQRASLDLSVVRASGTMILLDDLEDALRDLATRPVVGRCRVAVVEGAERLRDVAGNRMLKPLEEPPAGSHVILVTDRPEDLLPTIRSRCLPVPFRNPGWRAVAARLVQQGESPGRAESLARSEGALALTADPFLREMRDIGVRLGLDILRGDRTGRAIVAETQAAMERAAADNPSEELVELRRVAADLEGRRGGRTAAKRAEDQEKRERRRAVSDGWGHVLSGAGGIVADGLAVALGAEGGVRHRDRLDEICAAGADAAFCERALEEIELTRGELVLNPTVDVAAEAMLVRIALARAGERHPLTPHGRLPW